MGGRRYVWPLAVGLGLSLGLPASLGALPMVGLEAWAAQNNLTLAETGDHVLRGNNQWCQVVWEVNSRRVVFNGLSVYLNGPALKQGRSWTISRTDAGVVLPALLNPSRFLTTAGYGVIVLDPGHGGDDPGAPGPGQIREKKLTLDLAKRVRYKLHDAGVTVYLTRERDANVELEERVAKTSRWHADLFVSIHLNSSGDRTVSGFETFVVPAAGYPATAQLETNLHRSDYTPGGANRYDAANAILAYFLQRGLLSCARGEDRGVKRARYYVIRNVNCPAALVECGFLSNRQEGARLVTDSYRDAIAEGLARGILTYLSRAREARYYLLRY